MDLALRCAAFWASVNFCNLIALFDRTGVDGGGNGSLSPLNNRRSPFWVLLGLEVRLLPPDFTVDAIDVSRPLPRSELIEFLVRGSVLIDELRLESLRCVSLRSCITRVSWPARFQSVGKLP